MEKEKSDLKIMEEMERKELQDRYIRFDWATGRFASWYLLPASEM